MTFPESDLLPLAGVQHVVFCARQAALMYVERLWADNVLTIDGAYRHAAVHEVAPRRELRGDVLVARGLPLRSLSLGLSGVADVVEFHRVAEAWVGSQQAGGVARAGARLPGLSGRWAAFPVEYKRGRPKRHRADEVQLCAQAMCLEEMLSVKVEEGALFYGRTQRRRRVEFSAELRELTREAARRFHRLVAEGVTPRAAREPKCVSCSLVEVCMPEAMTRRASAGRYVVWSLGRVLREESEEE